MSIADQILAKLQFMAKNTGSVRPANLVGRLALNTDISPVDIQDALRELRARGEIAGVSTRGEPIGMVKLLKPLPPLQRPLLELEWDKHLEALAPEWREVLLPAWRIIDRLDEDDRKKLVDGLANMIATTHDPLQDRREISARHLLGSAKIMDHLPAVFLDKLKLASEQPARIVLAGPSDPERMLLIENQASFESALQAGLAEKAMLVATFGFSLSWNSLGNPGALSAAKSLIAAGNPPPIGSCIGAISAAFWGDLDIAGLAIHARLKARIPDLRIAALYRPMEELMRNGHSHAYTNLVDKAGQDGMMIAPADEDATELYVLCRQRGIDQEVVSVRMIAEIGAGPRTAA